MDMVLDLVAGELHLGYRVRQRRFEHAFHLFRLP